MSTVKRPASRTTTPVSLGRSPFAQRSTWRGEKNMTLPKAAFHLLRPSLANHPDRDQIARTVLSRVALDAWRE